MSRVSLLLLTIAATFASFVAPAAAWDVEAAVTPSCLVFDISIVKANPSSGDYDAIVERNGVGVARYDKDYSPGAMTAQVPTGHPQDGVTVASYRVIIVDHDGGSSSHPRAKDVTIYGPFSIGPCGTPLTPPPAAQVIPPGSVPPVASCPAHSPELKKVGPRAFVVIGRAPGLRAPRLAGERADIEGTKRRFSVRGDRTGRLKMRWQCGVLHGAVTDIPAPSNLG